MSSKSETHHTCGFCGALHRPFDLSRNSCLSRRSESEIKLEVFNFANAHVHQEDDYYRKLIAVELRELTADTSPKFKHENEYATVSSPS